MENKVSSALRVCETFVELKNNIEQLSCLSDFAEHYRDDKDKKCNAFENLMKVLSLMGPIVDKQMRGSLKEKDSESLGINDEIERSNFTTVIEGQVNGDKIFLQEIKAIQEQEITDARTAIYTGEGIIKSILDVEKKLRAEMDLIEAEYQVLCEVNIHREKALYIAKKKSEQVYLDTLKKYDEDVGCLYRTMKSLTQVSTSLDTKLKDLKDKLVIQEKIYDELKDERDREIMEAFTRDLENFQRERAARIIQRTWRRYLERLILRRKKKSKKKR